MANGNADLSLRFRRKDRSLPEPLDFARTLWVLEGIYREGLWTVAWRDDPLEEYERSYVEPPFFGRPIPPPLPPALRLRVQRVQMESPFEVLSQIPGEFYAAGGAYAIASLSEKIERVWNMPARIRRERIEIDRDTWRAMRERDLARDEYYRDAARRSRFELEEATITLPDDWDWPPRD